MNKTQMVKVLDKILKNKVSYVSVQAQTGCDFETIERLEKLTTSNVIKTMSKIKKEYGNVRALVHHQDTNFVFIVS